MYSRTKVREDAWLQAAHSQPAVRCTSFEQCDAFWRARQEMASDPRDWHPWLVAVSASDAALEWLRGVVRDCLACTFPSSSVGREGQDPESTSSC